MSLKGLQVARVFLLRGLVPCEMGSFVNQGDFGSLHYTSLLLIPNRAWGRAPAC